MNSLFLLSLLAQAGLPWYVYAVIAGVVLGIVALIILAYRSYIRTPESADDYSLLHTTSPATVEPAPPAEEASEVEPAAAVESPLDSRTAQMRAPATRETKMFPPATPVAPPPAPPARAAQEPPPPARETLPRPRPAPIDEEMPPARRSLETPEVDTLSTPGTEPLPELRRPRETAPPPVSRERRAESAEAGIFGSLAEVQRRERRGRWLTTIILVITSAIILIVAYQQIPLVRDTVTSLSNRLQGRSEPPPPAPETAKLEASQRLSITSTKLTVQGRVRNISDQPLTALYAELSLPLPSGKLAETRLVPITAVDGTGPDNKTLQPSQGGQYTAEFSATAYGNPELKRILNEAGTEVKFEKK